MAKGYWISFYRSVSNATALGEYAKLAGPAIEAGGGRFLARGVAVKAYEAGVKDRSVVIEFDSVEELGTLVRQIGDEAEAAFQTEQNRA